MTQNTTSSASLNACVMLDARYLNGRHSGIGRYTLRLVEELLAQDDTLRLRLLTHPNNPAPLSHPRVQCQTFDAAPNSLTTRLRLARSIDFRGIDLFHSPFNILPADLPVPAIFTLHDIMWLLNPDYCTDVWWRKLVTGTFYQNFIPRSAAEAEHILTVSHTSRQAIEEHFPAIRGRVSVTYNGLDPFFTPMPPEEAWPLLGRWLAPRSRFVLVVGQGSPYKNHPGALRAFIEAFADDPHTYFVLVRRLDESSNRELGQLLDDPRLGSRVIRIGYVSSDELRALYSMAMVFLFPSFYEGFGLPALEAMACGTPVITSDRGAPAEVCQGGAMLVDPHNTQALARALRQLRDDPDLAHELRHRGQARAAQFTWEACARAALEAYRRVLHPA
ncbi:glycosyltransferase family 1 protein [Lujinxingia sediminis]|uniref:Glycosyltransferase family 1 protein n=1 Tax=Lujinxingia sediminis TaxID=2480984 RepID=A0ABY0CWK2_9DELT|nr:glycosyltransferase family 1 protein [Lujinxingia sediminis]RVU46984.1 glycosyltransferase family 1 protein [Lujinxingia sediminis]